MNHRLANEMSLQLTRELHAGYLYLSMSAAMEEQNLPGMAHWFRRQAQEEVGHAMKFYHYLVERGAKVSLGAIDQPTPGFSGPLAAFEAGLAHEKAVTAHIARLYDLSLDERDHASTIFLQWFVTEQVEEEQSFAAAVEGLKALAGSPHGLFLLDREMKGRE